MELETSSDEGPSSSDDKSSSTQSAVDHLAAETPANQHSGPGASDSVFSLSLASFGKVMLIYLQDIRIHAQYILRKIYFS